MFALNIKRFVKSPLFVAGTACYLVVLYFLLPVHKASGIEDMSNSTLTTLPFSFLFFMTISYEFFYRIHAEHLQEVTVVSPMGQIREKSYGVLLFTIFDFILYLVFWAMSVQGTASVLGVVNADWFLLLAKSFFIYHFLFYFFAILVGLLVSFVTSRLKAFGILVTVFALFSKIMLPIIMRCVNGSQTWTHFFDIFGIMNRNYYLFCDLFYNYSAESVNVQRIMFWILLSLSILSLIGMSGKKYLVTAFMFLCTGITFVLYIQPTGYRYNGGDWGSYMEEQQYYMLEYENDRYGIGRSYKEADFRVLKYEGRLSAERVLRASVGVTVDKSDLEEYCFTLYHGYEIKKVTDQNGNHLEFEQNGDHVRVYSTGRPVAEICFEYAGYSRKYVATSQAVFLGGNFPYLPQPGWNVYSTQPVEVFDDPQIDASWDREHELKGLGYQTVFDVWFETGQKVYSNLTETEASHFTGVSEGATFVACPFVKEMKIDNCTLYYSELCAPYMNSRIQQKKEKFQQILGDYPALKNKENLKIFDLVFMGDGDPVYFFASDHLIADDDKIAECYFYYLKYGETPTYTDMEKESGEFADESEGRDVE